MKELTRRITRRIGHAVVTMSPDGISLRGYRCRKAIRLSWEQIASLSTDETPVLVAAEAEAGIEKLKSLNAELSKAVRSDGNTDVHGPLRVNGHGRHEASYDSPEAKATD